MTIFQSVILALVQGITEFLPVSSSAHLILVPVLLGWKDQGIAFDVIVHVGTLTAVMAYFRRDIGAILANWFQQWKPGFYDVHGYARLGNLLILATIPTGIVGLLGKDFIEHHLRSPLVIAATTLIFGILLGVADRCRGGKEIKQISAWQAILFGLAQSLALIPGTSRSGITLTAGLFMGYSRETAARFSFLMSIPIIILSGLLTAKDLLKDPSHVVWAPLIVGFIVSAVSAYLCIALFMKALAKIGMIPYVIYRIFLCLVLVIFVLNGAFSHHEDQNVMPEKSNHGKTVITIPLTLNP